MQLYTFFRSGTAHRLRIALNLKGLTVDHLPVDLRVDAQLLPAYRAVNPQALLPALVLDGAQGAPAGTVLIQSPAILEWLEETHPTPPLLPTGALNRARVRALAAIVGCDIHPVNNRRILQALRKDYGAGEPAINTWCGSWISDGFDALEALLAADTQRGAFCWGNTPTLADVYLVPQVESARRFQVDIQRWPRIAAVDAACAALPAFQHAAPANQPDAG